MSNPVTNFIHEMANCRPTMMTTRTCYTDKQIIAANMVASGPLYEHRMATWKEEGAIRQLTAACTIEPFPLHYDHSNRPRPD